MKTFTLLFLLTCLISLHLPLHAQENDLGRSTIVESEDVRSDHYFTFQLDNDLFAGTDDGYTNGVRLSWNYAEKPWLLPNFIDQGLRKVVGGVDSNEFFKMISGFEDPDAAVFNYGFSISQLMFTPTTFDTLTPPPGERPYAAHLGLGFAVHAKDNNTLHSAQITFGITGESAFGEEAQDFIHDLRDIDEFQGWDSQIPQEFTVTLSIANKRRYEFAAAGLSGDGYIEYGASVGNFRTDAYLGLLARIGYNVTSTFADPRISINSYTLDGADRNSVPYFGKFSTYMLFGLRGYGIAHDITLDGPVFRSFDTNVTREPWVGEVYAGFGARYGTWEFVYTQTFRSEEFKEENGSDSFGSFAITKRF